MLVLVWHTRTCHGTQQMAGSPAMFMWQISVLVPGLVLFKFQFWSLFKFPVWFLLGFLFWFLLRFLFWFLFKFLFRFLFRHRCMGKARIQNSWKLTWFGTAKSSGEGVGWNSCASDAVAVVWESVKHHLFLGSDRKQKQQRWSHLQ